MLPLYYRRGSVHTTYVFNQGLKPLTSTIPLYTDHVTKQYSLMTVEEPTDSSDKIFKNKHEHGKWYGSIRPHDKVRCFIRQNNEQD